MSIVNNVNGYKTDVVAVKLIEGDLYSTAFDSQGGWVDFNIDSEIHPRSCKDATYSKATFGDIRVDGVAPGQRDIPSARVYGSEFCPGMAQVYLTPNSSGAQNVTAELGIPPSRRNVSPPVIESITQIGNTARVAVSDNLAITDVSVDINGQGIYPLNRQCCVLFAFDKNLTLDYPLAGFSPGLYSLHVVVKDSTGITAEKTQSVSIQ